MIIRGGHTIEVYRSTGKDRHGDNTAVQMVGTIDNVVLQWVSAAQVAGAGEVTSMTTVAFCPKDAAVLLNEDDRFKLNGDTYAVVGGRLWDEDHPVTGTNFGYYIVKVVVMS